MRFCACFCANRLNVTTGPHEKRVLITGLHTVADIYCLQCEVRGGGGARQQHRHGTGRLGAWAWLQDRSSWCAVRVRPRQTLLGWKYEEAFEESQKVGGTREGDTGRQGGML